LSLFGLQNFDLAQGSLKEVRVVEILGTAYARKITGRLNLRDGKHQKKVYFLSGMPVYATSTLKNENLLEVASRVQRLSRDDLLQLRMLKDEKGISEEELFKKLGLLTDSEIYALQVETYMQTVLEACGWNEGNYSFFVGDDFISDVPVFDLNPLEIIYQGLKTFQALDLGDSLKSLEKKRAKLNHGWEQFMSLPEVYYQRSDVLDMFEKERIIGECVPRLYEEFGDLGEAMLFLYLLLITGLLRVMEEEEGGPSVERKSEKGPLYQEEDGSLYVRAFKKREGKQRHEPEKSDLPPDLSLDSAGVEEPEKEKVPEKEVLPPPPVISDREKEEPNDIEVMDYSGTISEVDKEEEESAPPEPPSLEIPGPEPKKEGEPPPPEKPEQAAPPSPEPPPAEEVPEALPEIEAIEEIEPIREELYEKLEGESIGGGDDLASFEKVETALNEVARLFDRALTHFEKLCVDEEDDYNDIERAYQSLLDEISIDHLSDSTYNQLLPQYKILREMVEESYAVLIDPDERSEHEDIIFRKRLARVSNIDMKRRLAVTRMNKGHWYLNVANRPDLARKCYQSALELDDTQPVYYAFTGWACYRQDDQGNGLMEARHYLRQALAINPNNDDAHYFLGVIAKRVGDRETAISHFGEAIRVNPEHAQARREYDLIQTHTKQKSVIKGLFAKK